MLCDTYAEWEWEGGYTYPDCEVCGFVLLHEHRAWLVEDRGAQWGLFGELHERTVERKSFFRRLAERKGSPRIDWETVLCMQKPA